MQLGDDDGVAKGLVEAWYPAAHFHDQGLGVDGVRGLREYRVYNDMKDFGAKSQMVWEDKNDIETVEGPSGEKLTQPKRKPIVELVFDKSKIYKGFDGVIYYRLDPATGRYDEEPAHRQKEWETFAL